MPISREVSGAHAQFVGRHLQPHQRAHAREQRDVGDRLGEEIVGAGLEPAHPVGRLVERRHHHHRNVMRRRIGLEPAADLEAVHLGHHHVEQHDVALGALADRQRFRAATSRSMTSKYSAVSRASSSFTLAGDVVDDENTRGHPSSSGVPRKCRTVSMNLPTEIGFDR